MEIQTDRLSEIFLQLAQINAVSGQERPVADYVKQFLTETIVSVVEDDAGDHDGGSAGNVICTFKDGGEIVLLAHMDTARPTKNLKAGVFEDRIESDGTTILGVDNRAGMALLLYTLETAIQHSDQFPGFTVAFTIAEETTLAGSKHLQLNGNIQMGYAFDSSLRPGNFIHGSYGAKRFDIQVTGKAAHSGIAPENGVNAIQIASEAIASLPGGRVDVNTTMNIAKIAGGAAINVVPEHVSVEGEVRGLANSDVDKIIDLLDATFGEKAGEHGGKSLLNSRWDFQPYEIATDAPVYTRLVEAFQAVNLEQIPHITPGGSDANSLNVKGIPALNVGIGAQNPHANNEFILLQDFENSARVIQALLSDSTDCNPTK